MTCKQLGGACDKEFHAETFEEIPEISKQHGTEMFQFKDEAHLEAMNKIMRLMQTPGGMEKCFTGKREGFETLPDS